MRTARFIVRNMAEFRRGMEQENQERIKAGETAAKVEGYRLHAVLKRDLARGTAGGSGFAPLSIIARIMKLTGRRSQRSDARRPLARMAVPIRYRTRKASDGTTLVQVGLVDPNRGAKLSKKWVYLGFILQEGGEVPLSDKSRQNILKRGRQLARGQDQAARFFFLKKATKTVRLPPRPFIEMFWRVNADQAARNIEANYHRKMAGERI